MTPATPEERDRLITVENNYAHIKETLGEIHGEVTKITKVLPVVENKIDSHISNHVWFAGVILGTVAIVVSIILHFS